MGQVSKKLLTLEKQIEDGVKSIRVALLEIHDSKLYGSSFEDYCKQRWGFSRSRGYEIIEAARTDKKVSGKVDTSALKTQHLLVISKAPPERQADVAATVLEQCEIENRKPTAKDFKQAVKAVAPAKEQPKLTTHQREPGDESEPDGEDSVVKPPKSGTAKPQPGPIHKQAVSSYFAPLSRTIKKLSDINGGEGEVYKQAKHHLNEFSAAFKKLGKGEQ